MDQEISKYLLQLRRSHPFLATISLFATYRFTEETSTFLSQGKNILINPDFFSRTSSAERVGLLLHVTLHTALQHSARCGLRNKDIWNIAADIVVNNIILETEKFSPPSGTVIIPNLSNMSVEQVYEYLVQSQKKAQVTREIYAKQGVPVDGELAAEMSTASKASSPPQVATPSHHEVVTSAQPAANSLQQFAEYLSVIHPHYADLWFAEANEKVSLAATNPARDYWRDVFRRAETVQRLQQKKQGHIPAGMLREIKVLQESQLDWRTILWRFMAKTPCDYSGFDRRFIHLGLYLDQLESETLHVHLAVDTSASVSDEELSRLLSEVDAIRCAHPFINISLYYIDADIYGPYELDSQTPMPEARGGGGTNFTRFFQLLNCQMDSHNGHMVIYLTDGFADFPQSQPDYPVLWVVTWSGLASDKFPFGETLRIADMNAANTEFIN